MCAQIIDNEEYNMAEVNNVEIDNVSSVAGAFNLSGTNFDPDELKQYYRESPELKDAWNLVCELFIRCLKNYSADESTIFVVKERRAFVLFLIYLYTECDSKSIKDIYGKIYSDTNIINVIKAKEKDISKIIIIDDIIIHGRAVNKLINDIHKVNHEIEIIVECCMKYKDMEFTIEPHINTSVGYENVTETFWKKTSNQFVDIIQHSGLSYSSFAPMYHFSCENDLSFTSVNNQNGVLSLTSSSQSNQLKGHLYIWYKLKSQIKLKDVEIKNNLLFFIRKYTYYNISKGNSFKNSNNSIYVPFTILPFAYFKKNDESDIDSAIGEYKRLTYIFSIALMDDVAKSKSIKGNNIYKCFEPIAFGNRADFNLSFKSKSILDFSDDSNILSNESLDVWCNSLKKWESESKIEDNLSLVIDDFIGELHSLNEQRARNKDSRLPGAFIISMLGMLVTITGIDFRKIIEPFFSVMISRWDSGIANYTVDYQLYNETVFVGGSITDGEQAYHSGLEPNAEKEIGMFQYIYSKCGRDLTLNILDHIKVHINNYPGISYRYIDFIINYIKNSTSTGFREIFDFIKHKSVSNETKTMAERAITEVLSIDGNIYR